VTVTVETSVKGTVLRVADDGPAIPEETFAALLTTRLDPSTLGRPSTIALFWAEMLAEHLGTEVVLVKAEPGAHEGRGCRLEVTFPTA
jgi:hypothetical protein